MSISIACENCTARLKVSETFAGKTIKCPKCSSPLPVRTGGGPPADDERRSPRRPATEDDEPRRRQGPLDDDGDDDIPRRRHKPQDDGEGDAPRRRHTPQDDGENDIPLRRRKTQDRDDDPDDLPRRRRHRDEDSEDEPRKKKRKKAARWSFNLSSNAIMWILIILGVVGVAGFFGIRYLVRKSELSPFNNRIGEYLATARPGSEGAYVKGKILPVNSGDRAVDWFYYEVPETMRANSPEEVGTVVLLQWGEDQVGQYGGSGGGAFVRTCHVTVVDHAKREIVGQSQFRGGDPPRTSRRGSSQHGSYPTEQILSYLRGLPKR